MAAAKPSAAMRMWSALTWAAFPFFRRHLQKRVIRGKEDPDRWREKLGKATTARPVGTLIWLHAVGLGEVLALRGLVAKLHAQQPDWQYLITSNTLTSAQVLAQNMPPQTMHQFAPLDTPQAAKRFLDHWQPDLAIWAEQELWPGLVYRTDVRGISLAMVNARMNSASFAKRQRVARLFADAFARFAIVSAQDAETATHLSAMGAGSVRIDGSLKPIAPPLTSVGLAALQTQTQGRFVWVMASSHPADEGVAIAAHKRLLMERPDALLIIAPRDINRGARIVVTATSEGLNANARSDKAAIAGQVYVADSFGEMGLWYRLADAALIGGTFDQTEGHNPWEAIQLRARVLHGPRIGNFKADYSDLSDAGAATMVNDPEALCAALLSDSQDNVEAGISVLKQKNTQFDNLVAEIINLEIAS